MEALIGQSPILMVRFPCIFAMFDYRKVSKNIPPNTVSAKPTHRPCLVAAPVTWDRDVRGDMLKAQLFNDQLQIFLVFSVWEATHISYIYTCIYIYIYLCKYICICIYIYDIITKNTSYWRFESQTGCLRGQAFHTEYQK